MRDHDWERQILDGGHLGGCAFWVCRRCDATNHAGAEFQRSRPGPDQFLACGCGPDVTALPVDCDAAIAWIATHREICPRARDRQTAGRLV